METALPLLQFVTFGDKTWGTRCFLDGRVEAYSDVQVDFTDEGFVSQSVPLEWRPRAHLSSDELHQLVALLRDSDFWKMAQAPDSGQAILDGPHSVWEANLGGANHRVVVPSDLRGYPALEQLRLGFETLVAAAITREAESKG